MRKIIINFICIFVLGIIVCNIFVDDKIQVNANEFKDITAKSYIVVDDYGNTLIENNADDKKEVASICKLMTILITLENIEKGNLSLEDKLYTSIKASEAEGSQAFLDAGSEYTIRDLLKSVIVASANDSAIVLAEGIAGSEDIFVKMMNEKAKLLGMHNTRYANSTGLPSFEQYSTARDTAIILNEVSKYGIYREYCNIWIDKLIHPSGRITELVNTNRLIKYYDYCETGKTGYTDEAGYCLSSTASNRDFNLTCVVLGCNTSADRFTESIKLYNYAYANFINEKIFEKGQIVDNNIIVKNGKQDYLKLIANNDYSLLQNRLNKKDYTINIEFPENLKAPIKQGDYICNIDIVVEGIVVGKVELVAGENVDKQTFNDSFIKVLERFSLFN
jgi:D-alanyl-D-alanine carboxypeptidase (penicillin-binding protein 5/6)